MKERALSGLQTSGCDGWIDPGVGAVPLQRYGEGDYTQSNRNHFKEIDLIQ